MKGEFNTKLIAERTEAVGTTTTSMALARMIGLIDRSGKQTISWCLVRKGGRKRTKMVARGGMAVKKIDYVF